MSTKTTTEITFPDHGITLEMTVTMSDSGILIHLQPTEEVAREVKTVAPATPRPPKAAPAATGEAPKRRGRPPKAAATGEAPKRRGRPPKNPAPEAGAPVAAEAAPEPVPATEASELPPVPALPPIPGTEDLAAA